MRLILLIGFLFSFQYYVYQAFNTAFIHYDAAIQTIAWSIYYFLLFMLILPVLLGLIRLPLLSNKGLRRFLYAFAGIIIFAHVLIASTFVLDEVRRLIIFVYRSFSSASFTSNTYSPFMAQIALFVGALPLLLMPYGILRNQYRFRVYRTNVLLPELPPAFNGLKIVQLSDIHAGSFSRKAPLEKAVKQINALQADIVFFTGDLVNSIADEMDEFVDIFKQIKAKHGVYAILGNHDYGDYIRAFNEEDRRDIKTKSFNKLLDIHRLLGWKLLRNESEIIHINETPLAIIGVENYSANARFHKYGRLDIAYQGTQDIPMKILLSHDPSHWDDQVNTHFQDIDLTLSGHTHGGQFGIETRFFKWSPAQYPYPQWAGLYQKGKQFLYVNRGFGVLGYPGRIGILPEITLLVLERG